MVALAVSTGLRCCDIVALRLDEIDSRRNEIRLVQAKTSGRWCCRCLPLAGNAVAEWILHGRPECDAPEVFTRLQPPYARLGKSAGSTLMRRRLARAGIDHAARDGKSFHALRRTTGTRLIESGAGLPLAAQILGHARINSSGRYYALASEQLRQCCLPLDGFPCTREGLQWAPLTSSFAPHIEGHAPVAGLAGAQPARPDERASGLRQVLRLPASRRDGADPGAGDRVVPGHHDGHLGRLPDPGGPRALPLPPAAQAWTGSSCRRRGSAGRPEPLPHMFTDEELAAFFCAADSIAPEYRSPFRECTIPVIFRLILGAGLRPPEARRLRRRDVDAQNAVVMIERSKRNKDRRVPVTAGTLPGCSPASTGWRTCAARTGNGSSRTSMAASTPRNGSSPATTCPRAGGRDRPGLNPLHAAA